MAVKITIPRGLQTREVVAYGLTGKQVLYLAAGIGGALFAYSLPVPLDLRIVGGVFSIAGSLWISLAKIHQQEADQYVYNSIKYTFRQKEFDNHEEKEENNIIVRFHPRGVHSSES